MNDLNLIFTVNNIGGIDYCTINSIEVKLPSDELYKVFNNFKRKYPSTRKTIESNTYQDTFNSIDSNELFKLITSSLNYQKSIFLDKKKKYKKGIIISSFIAIISIIGILYLGSSLIIPFSFLAFPICSTVVGIKLKKEINKINLELSKVIKNNNILLQKINKEQKIPTNSTTKSQTHSYKYQNSKSPSSTLDIPLEIPDNKENASYDYQNGKLSSDFDVLSVFEKDKKGPKK